MLHTVCVRRGKTQGTADAEVQQQQRFHASTVILMSQEGQHAQHGKICGSKTRA